MISVWPLEAEANVIHQDLFYSFINQLYAGEGLLQASDLSVAVDTDGIGVKIAPGGVVVAYDSAPGGKRVFYNSAENKSGPNKHPNASFNVNTAHWSPFGAATLTRETGVYQTPPASMKIATSGASAFAQGAYSIFYKVNPSELQQISVWVWANTDTIVKLGAVEYDAALAQGAIHAKDAAGIGTWSKITLDPWTTAASCRYLITTIQISAPGSTNVFLDDFTCQQNFDWIQGFEVADPTNPRVDRLVVQIRDSSIAGGGDTAQDGKFRVISGTPTSGATVVNLNGAAAVPANCFLIANVLVPAAAFSLVSGNIDNTVKTAATLNVETMPIGIPYPYMGSAAPTGYLLCDGTAISRTGYPLLFAVCGTSYGVGDGSTTFNLPDMRGRMPAGLGTHADVDALGDNEGEATVGNRRPKHKHTVNDPQHHHPYVKPSATTAGGGGNASAEIAGTLDTSNASTGITVGPQTNSPLDGAAYLVFNWIVRAA